MAAATTPYTIPTYTAPPPGPMPAGPYAGDKPMADQAWANTMAQIGEQRRELYHNYGTNDQGQIDIAGNPYGLYANLMTQGAQMGDQAGAAFRHRGLTGSGLAASAEEAAQGAYQGGVAQANEGLFSGLTNLGLAEGQATETRDTRKGQDDLQDYLYNVANNKFPVAPPRRTDAQTSNLVANMFKAWLAAYDPKGMRTGAGGNIRNRGGLTFEQRLAQLGQGLYDPSASYKVGGRTFGGT